MYRLTPKTSFSVPVLRATDTARLESEVQARSPEPLMLKAGLSAAQLARAIAPHAQRIWIAAGPGNNGGDGLQAAIHLQAWGFATLVSLVGAPEKMPRDAHQAYQRAQTAGVRIVTHVPDDWIAGMTAQDLCIDALLGTGASRAPSDTMQSWIAQINSSPAQVLSLDLPTGLHPDSGQPWSMEQGPGNLIQADHTLTFLAAKPGLLMGHGRDAAGEIWIDPLTEEGLPTNLLPQAWVSPPPAGRTKAHASHKGSHGDVAIVGGESIELRGLGMSGAAVLAASSALHAGAGRVILCTPGGHRECLNAPPDLMQRHFEQLDLGALTVAAGCGGGQAIRPLMAKLLQRSARLVADADALNAIAQDPHLQQLLRARSKKSRPTVLTPHPLEAARLLGCSSQDVQSDRVSAARKLADGFECTVVLKGSGTVIASPAKTSRINITGNGRLATGGTGDVLAGLLARLLAQGLSDWDAACSAVWRHGMLSDEWPRNEALTASRLASRIA